MTFSRFARFIFNGCVYECSVSLQDLHDHYKINRLFEDKLQSSINILSQPSSPAVGACTPVVGACTPGVGACAPAVRACTPAGGLVRDYTVYHRGVWNQRVRGLQGTLHWAPVKYACHEYKDACRRCVYACRRCVYACRRCVYACRGFSARLLSAPPWDVEPTCACTARDLALSPRQVRLPPVQGRLRPAGINNLIYLYDPISSHCVSCFKSAWIFNEILQFLCSTCKHTVACQSQSGIFFIHRKVTD